MKSLTLAAFALSTVNARIIQNVTTHKTVQHFNHIFGEPKVCTCDNGFTEPATVCRNNGEQICVSCLESYVLTDGSCSCDKGFIKNNGVCKEKREQELNDEEKLCECSNGVLATTADCPDDMETFCYWCLDFDLCGCRTGFYELNRACVSMQSSIRNQFNCISNVINHPSEDHIYSLKGFYSKSVLYTPTKSA